jgi:hypothetical protein
LVFVLLESDDLATHPGGGQAAQKSVGKARRPALDLRETWIPHSDVLLPQELGRRAMLDAQIAEREQKKFNRLV